MTLHRPIISSSKYLASLVILFLACGDDAAPAGLADVLDATQQDLIGPALDTNQPDAEVTGQPDTTGGTGVTTNTAAVATTPLEGHSRTVIDASSSGHWTHLSLFTGQLAVPAPAGQDPYHLGFQRYLVRLGDGVRAMTLDGTPFAELAAAPSEGEFRVDGETAAIADWWDYDGRTHTLSAKPDRVYVVEAGARYFKLRFRDYYDQSGSPGHVTLDWAEIAPAATPTAHRTMTLPLSPGAFTYADLRAHVTLEAAPAAGSLGWDLAVKRVSIQTNGGTSGEGLGGALELGVGELSDFVALPDDAVFTSDAGFPVAGPPGSGEESRNGVLDAFYTYDPMSHTVTVEPKVFALRLADGAVVKLRFLAWSSSSIEFEYAPLAVHDD